MPQPELHVQSLDHLVLTVADIPAAIAFYENTLGMHPCEFQTASGQRRWSLQFGNMKINLHQHGAEFDPKSAYPTPGSADLCFLTAQPLADWADHLEHCGVVIEEGPVARTGAVSALMSLYVRDPDRNLIEIAVQH